MQTIKALPSQTLVDVALQTAGSTEALFDVALANGISITDDIVPGNAYAGAEVVDNKVVLLFQGVQKPASGITTMIRQGGIGYMQIGNNFIVS